MEKIDKIKDIIQEAELKSQNAFREVDDIALENQRKVLEAFKKERIAERHLKGSSGYGYGDIGREALCRLYADVFHTQDALVSPLIVNGTHALTIGLFALLNQGDALFSISGEPYDTLMGVIKGEKGSLASYGIGYYQIDLKNGEFDVDGIMQTLQNHKDIKLIYITRSRGYTSRNALNNQQIGDVISVIKKSYPYLKVMVDNCYGEFTQIDEPSDHGADLVVGSLIKNIGGGIAPTGGYLAGTKECVELAAFRLTAPGLGNEVGSYMYGYQNYFQGLFLAPHVVANAIKGSILIANAMQLLGFKTIPSPDAPMNDIIRSVIFNTKEELISFIQNIQKYSPIDSDVLPEPWDMPGYNEQVIMAAGTFVGGASIELSADAPIKSPYIAYVQGGLTYEHVKIALEGILDNLIK